jgi:hypothetical protein
MIGQTLRMGSHLFTNFLEHDLHDIVQKLGSYHADKTLMMQV